MIDRKSRQLLGSYLPKDVCASKINCNDDELKKALTLLLRTIYIKINIDNDWTEKDYIKFRQKLAQMDVDVFKNTFFEMLRFIELPKSKLRVKLKDLDQKLSTHIFDSEKVIQNVIDPETMKVRQEYKFVSHCFDVSDIVVFLNRLMSNMNKCNNILLNYYNNKLKSNGTIEEEQEKIKLLLEMLENKEISIVCMITAGYHTLTSEVYSDEIIGSFINRMYEQVIENNKKNLKSEIEKLENNKNTAYKVYTREMKLKYYTEQVKKDAKYRTDKYYR